MNPKPKILVNPVLMAVILLLSMPFFICLQTSAAQETVGFTNPDATYHLDNYRLPTWGYDLMSLDFGGSYFSWDRTDNVRNRFIEGTLTPEYLYYRESEESILNIKASLPQALDRQTTETPEGAETTSTEFSTTFDLSGDAKYYLRQQMFAVGSASAFASSQSTI